MEKKNNNKIPLFYAVKDNFQLSRKKMTLSKLKFSDDNFYLVTVPEKNVMATKKQ